MKTSRLNEMRILKIGVFLLLFFIIDQLAGAGLKFLYKNQRTGAAQSLNFVLNDCRAEILVFGNSRAQHHYDPKILADSLHMTCYNAGLDGGHSILLPYAQIQIVLKRYIPKIIIMEFSSAYEMEYRQADYDKMAILLPYYKQFKEIRPLVELKSPFERLKLLSSIYPYNSKLINLLRFNTDIDKNRRWMTNGYIPIYDKEMNKSMLSHVSYPQSKTFADPCKISALEDIISLCREKKVSLYLMFSPRFYSDNPPEFQVSQSQAEIDLVVEKEGVKLLDFRNDTSFRNRLSVFADPSHLNKVGAEEYSSKIAAIIKSTEKRPAHSGF